MYLLFYVSCYIEDNSETMIFLPNVNFNFNFENTKDIFILTALHPLTQCMAASSYMYLIKIILITFFLFYIILFSNFSKFRSQVLCCWLDNTVGTITINIYSVNI